MVKIANLVFNPFINDSRVEKTSKSLVNNGYHVEVIAHLNKELKKEEQKNGYTIRRFSYLDRTITKDKLGKLKAYLKYVKESVKYCKDFDILHCNDLNTLPIAFIIKKFFNKNIKIVYDAHEYETETYALKGMQKKIAKVTEKFLIKYTDKIITVSESIANEYSKLYNILKPALVLNAPSYKNVEKYDKFREVFDIDREQTIFLYQGGLGYNRGVELLVETFQKIEDSKSVIIFMGYGDLESFVINSAKNNNNIFFHKAVSPDILLQYTASADFGIATIEDSCLSYRYCLPNKLFEYIMAEVPVIVSNLPEMVNVVEELEIGVVLKEETTYGIQKAIEKALLINKKEINKNLKKAKDIYNWEEQEKVLLKLYKELE